MTPQERHDAMLASAGFTADENVANLQRRVINVHARMRKMNGYWRTRAQQRIRSMEREIARLKR